MSNVNNTLNEDSDFMLTTYDNPFNPFTQFEAWFKYDMMLGHNCCALLNEIAVVNTIQSEELNEKDINDAIDYIVENYSPTYKKVKRSDFEEN